MSNTEQPPPTLTAGATATPAVDYGRQPPLHRRRVFRRIIGGLCAILAVLLLVRYAHEKLAPTLARMREQRACTEYSMPADEVVYDEMRPREGYNFFRPGLGSSSVLYFSRPDPPLWSALQMRLAPNTAYPDTPLAFLHALCSPVGHERIVAVELAGGQGTGPLVFLRTFVFEWPSVFQSFVLRSSELRRVRTPDQLQTNAPFGSRDVRIFAGQPLPQDPSRFSILIETEGRRRTLTAQLRDDDTIGFEVGTDLIVEPVK